MTGKADFTAEEWELLVQGPPSAGILVVAAQPGGAFRETLSIAQAYVAARQDHGQSELLDEIVVARPELDHSRYHSAEELKEHSLQHLRDALALLERKATPAEVDAYRRFVVSLAEKVANAHREQDGAEATSEAERAVVEQITAALGAPTG